MNGTKTILELIVSMSSWVGSPSRNLFNNAAYSGSSFARWFVSSSIKQLIESYQMAVERSRYIGVFCIDIDYG